MVVIVCDDGRLLLHHRDDRPDIYYPGHWAGFGGALEAGEGDEDALLREMAEETGITLRRGEASVITCVPDPEARRDVTVYLLRRTIAFEEIDLQEGQGVGLFHVSELDDLQIPPFLHDVLDAHVVPLAAALAARRSPPPDQRRSCSAM